MWSEVQRLSGRLVKTTWVKVGVNSTIVMMRCDEVIEAREVYWDKGRAFRVLVWCRARKRRDCCQLVDSARPLPQQHHTAAAAQTCWAAYLNFRGLSVLRSCRRLCSAREVHWITPWSSNLFIMSQCEAEWDGYLRHLSTDLRKLPAWWRKGLTSIASCLDLYSSLMQSWVMKSWLWKAEVSYL